MDLHEEIDEVKTCADCKQIMAIVIQGAAEAKDASLSEHEVLPADIFDATKSSYANELSVMAINKILDMAIYERPGLTQSQYLLAVSLAVMWKARPNSFPYIIRFTAAILHLVILQHIKLEDRVIPAPEPINTAFFDAFLKTSKDILTSVSWKEVMKRHSMHCDLSDFADGRLFFQIQATLESVGVNPFISSTTLTPFNKLASLVDHLCGTKLVIADVNNITGAISSVNQKSDGELAKENNLQIDFDSPKFVKVLPFQNAVFDKHLEPVHLEIEPSVNDEVSTAKKFMDLNHWNSSKPLEQKKAVLTPRNWWQQKRDQLYMAEMRQYAESLLGSAGMSQTETIVVERSSISHKKPSIEKGKQPSKSNNKQRGSAKGPTVREQAAAAIQKAAADREQKKRNQWTVNIREFSKIDDTLTRFLRVEDHLSRLSKEDRRVMEPEILTYLLDILVQAVCNGNGSRQRTFLATHIWSVLTRLMKVKQGISTDIWKYAGKVCQRLELPSVYLETQIEQPLTFKLSNAIITAPRIMAGTDPVEFQLLYGGPFMDRSIDSAPDSRTPDFNPDSWQRDVLDQIDQKKSAFIVAPTSAGKTFIS